MKKELIEPYSGNVKFVCVCAYKKRKSDDMWTLGTGVGDGSGITRLIDTSGFIVNRYWKCRMLPIKDCFEISTNGYMSVEFEDD